MIDTLQPPACLDAQMLAAFIDGHLDAAGRARVEAHLAECGRCYEVFTETVHTAEDLADPGADYREPEPEPATARWRPRGTWWMASGLVAASVALLFVVQPTWLARRSPVDRAMHDFVGAVGQTRFTTARLSDDFAWAPAPSPVRGSEATPLSLDAQQAALKLRALAEGQRTAATLRGAGVALLSEGKVNDAVAALEEAVRLQPEGAFARVDLSAALLERWRRTQDPGDAARALDETERVRQIDSGLHAALFNRALALQALGMSAEARRAWEAYLAADPASEWATEARDHLAALPRSSAVSPQFSPGFSESELRGLAETDPLPLYRRLERQALPRWAGAILSGGTADLSEAQALAGALDLAGRDRYLVDLTALALRPAGSEARAVRCLASAITLMLQWWDVYDRSSYAAARQLAVDAREQLTCARAPTIDADLRLSIVDVASGRSAEGLRRLDSVERIASARRYPRALAVVHQLRGLASLQQSNIDRAVEEYRQAGHFAESAGDGELAWLSRAYIATAHSARGDMASAWSDLVTCARQLPVVESGRRRFQFFSRAATLALESGLHGTTLAIGDALLRDPIVGELAWSRVAGHLFRARAKAGLHSAQEATTDIDTARAIAASLDDRLLREEALAEVALMTGQLLARTDGATAARALSEALDFQHVRANQFRTASLLLARGRAYAQSGDPRRAEADWTEGAALLEDERVSIRDAQLRIARTAAMWELFEELVNSQRDRPALALQTIERTHARELLDSIAPETNLDPFRHTADFSWLPADAAALVYASLPERLLIWHITARGVSFTERPVSAHALRDLVGAGVRAIQGGGEPDLALGDALVPESLETGALANLIIVPDGALHQVPFGQLRRSSRRSRLLDTTVVTVSPSLSILRVLLQRPAWSRPVSPLLVGVEQGAPRDGLAPLPAVLSEVRALQALYPAARVLAGSDARKERVLRDLVSTDLLHFAGHAVSDAVHPSRSRLLLYPGSTADALRPADIAAARMRSGGVVILGACDTASGSAFRGEGPLNLARPFLVAGASSVVATLWPVRDREATRLLLELHALMAQGQPPAVALATVQRRDTARSRTSAAFVLIGRA